jgi:hypothetical protein
VANRTSAPKLASYTTVTKRSGGGFRGLKMGHASSHNSFNVVFVVTFFASFATFLIHFG